MSRLNGRSSAGGLALTFKFCFGWVAVGEWWEGLRKAKGKSKCNQG
jgi:hypothetical protein